MTNHAMSNWENTVAPTCLVDGTDERACTNTGCTYKETRSVNKLGHALSEWYTTLDPTCTEIGTKERACTNAGCNHTETQVIEKLGHSFASEFTVDVEATCHSVGSKSKHCSRCDATSEATEIAKVEHVYDEGTVTVPATASAEGLKTFSCKNCDHTRTESIQKEAPKMTEQSVEEWKSWSKSDVAVFRSNASIEDFDVVKINGEVLPAEYYTIREGSTVIEIKGEYLKTLDNGDYTVEIISKTGSATSTLVINKPFISNPAVLIPTISVLCVAVAAFVVLFILRKKKG